MVAKRSCEFVLTASPKRSAGSELEIDECIGFTRSKSYHQNGHAHARTDRDRKLRFFKNVLFTVCFKPVIDQNHDPGESREIEQFRTVLMLPVQMGCAAQHFQRRTEGPRPKENPAYAHHDEGYQAAEPGKCLALWPEKAFHRQPHSMDSS